MGIPPLLTGAGTEVVPDRCGKEKETARKKSVIIHHRPVLSRQVDLRRIVAGPRGRLRPAALFPDKLFSRIFRCQLADIGLVWSPRPVPEIVIHAAALCRVGEEVRSAIVCRPVVVRAVSRRAVDRGVFCGVQCEGAPFGGGPGNPGKIMR